MRHLILLACLVFLALPGSAERISVGPSREVSSLGQAIELAQAGDEIVLDAGTYYEHDLKVTKTLTIRGMENSVIDGQEKGTILSVEADDVVLDGLTLINVGHSFTKDFTAILISRSRNFKVTNNTLRNCFFGVMVRKSKVGEIAFNDISGEAEVEANSGNGVHIWHCSGVTIHDNRLHRLRDGIYLEFVKKSKIFRNQSMDNLRYGLHFMFSDNDEYHDNVFSNNGAGVAVMFSKFISMRRNKFVKNWGAASYGLLLKEIYDAEIEQNLFGQNTVGIYVEGSTRVNYKRNIFRRNGWAVKIAGACYSNAFAANDFVHNTFDLSYNSKLNDNSFEGNYWSDYTGYDLDRDGQGDVPYRPVKLFSYIVHRNPESIVLLRSLFIDMINFSEKVSPVFTPDDLMDNQPLMKRRNPL